MSKCIEKIYSVSALVGNGECNAHCAFCAAKGLRESARKCNQLQWERHLESAIRLSAKYQGWSLSLTSAGEPTCDPQSVTKALEIYSRCKYTGDGFPNVNLFSNGILLGSKSFCSQYLPRWRDLGLTNIAVSVHSVDERAQAQTYLVDPYPSFDVIFENIRKYGLGVRATLLLSRERVNCAEVYEKSVNTLISKGCTNITSWSVCNPDGSRNRFSIGYLGKLGILRWLAKNATLCHGHSWGGGVYDYRGNLLRITDYVTKHDPNKDFVRQLVVFQDETTCYSWIRKGALCMR